ncbi:pectin lyase-like protein [Tothia fuscella]|uniref:Pectin lyase-like protein n=1 Tax=Tothia fuscella TaxID=1048955 RepID=A0A9P4NGQ9_9PEZI|nr:pectin lyase-like protein [Tothia fuscella]
MPFAGSGYKVFRNVREYGALGDGVNDDWPSIQRAITYGDRCGANCPSTSTKGALIYFPAGTYVISQPLVQYYYTAFIGDPNDKPRIKAHPDFKGIALIDTNFYGSGGNNWYFNTNNFLRQIRNFVIDMTDMNPRITGGPANAGETDLPVGIHWQVSQACTMQNIDFVMPEGSDTRHVGIFQENGSGGFVSDLTFTGGKWAWVAGSQQYTTRNIVFKNCKTAVYMLWDWGWTFKNITVSNSQVAIDTTSQSDSPDSNTGRLQGVGSLTVLDSFFSNVDEVIRVNPASRLRPAIYLDNLRLQQASHVVKEWNGNDLYTFDGPLCPGWGLGWSFTDDSPNDQNAWGEVTPKPTKPASLLTNGGVFFEKSKPTYGDRQASDFINVLNFNVKNDGSSATENTAGINNALASAAGGNKVLVFPAGIYAVDDTVTVPSGSRIVGVLWSQLMATGSAFSDPLNPKVLAKIGNEGDRGTVEISDMILTTSGNTAGAILMEWNMHEAEQGSAGIWDTIFRVGGATGTDLNIQNCHWTRTFVDKDRCMAASLMLHVTSKSSIYAENLWLWTADHDIDDPQQDRINVYGGRGALIESKGPSWFHSVSNEHSTLYNWQLAGAENIYLGQIQSESPYFQPAQLPSTKPYLAGRFTSDPSFGNCDSNGNSGNALDTCREAWALRIIDSSNVYLYGGGFYSFFQNYTEDCSRSGGICQDRLIETSSSENLWLYNVYTVGAKEVISPRGEG